MKTKVSSYGLASGQRLLGSMRTRCSAFSLLELMLVVAIIALIAVAALPQVSEYNKRARGSRSSQNLKTLQGAIDQFTLDRGGPPMVSGAVATTEDTGAGMLGFSAFSVASPMLTNLNMYVQIGANLVDSPNAQALTTSGMGLSTSYGYKIFKAQNDTLVGLVGSCLNGYKRFEPSDATAGAVANAGINGYEDIGRLIPDATDAGTVANWIAPVSGLGGSSGTLFGAIVK